MSPYTCIKYAVEEHIAVVTLHRPERLNALSVALLQELQAAIRQARSDEDVRLVVITGSPRPDGRPCFSAGDDLKEMAAGVAMPPGLGFDLTNMIDDLLKPTIAVIDGICSTGAVELALSCDLRGGRSRANQRLALEKPGQRSRRVGRQHPLGTSGWFTGRKRHHHDGSCGRRSGGMSTRFCRARLQ